MYLYAAMKPSHVREPAFWSKYRMRNAYSCGDTSTPHTATRPRHKGHSNGRAHVPVAQHRQPLPPPLAYVPHHPCRSRQSFAGTCSAPPCVSRTTTRRAKSTLTSTAQAAAASAVCHGRTLEQQATQTPYRFSSESMSVWKKLNTCCSALTHSVVNSRSRTLYSTGLVEGPLTGTHNQTYKVRYLASGNN